MKKFIVQFILLIILIFGGLYYYSLTVKDGKITSEQKLAILNKLAELKSKFPPGSFKGMTKDQMKQKIQDHQAEIKAWLQNQGIDPTFLMPFEGIKRGW